MNRLSLVALATALLLALPACAQPTEPGDAPAVAKVKNISATDLHAAKDKVRLLVDVRTPAEFAEGHVPGALNIPVDQIDTRLAELGAPDDGEVHIICRSGGRSAKVSDKLAAKGYEAVNIEGGTLAWIKAGYDVDTPEPAKP